MSFYLKTTIFVQHQKILKWFTPQSVYSVCVSVVLLKSKNSLNVLLIYYQTIKGCGFCM